jgi:DNA-binding MarR family transcriptional regulator
MSRTASGRLLTDVILETFRANGLILAAGDELTRPWHLSSARWKVMGAIALARRPLHVAQIARNMGITRQSVHNLVGELVALGLLELAHNPDHKRAALVRLSAKGERVYGELEVMQAAWVNTLARRFSPPKLHAAIEVLKELSLALGEGSGRHSGHGASPRRKPRVLGRG